MSHRIHPISFTTPERQNLPSTHNGLAMDTPISPTSTSSRMSSNGLNPCQQTNPYNTTTIDITHRDRTNNKIDPLQQLDSTPIIIISPHTLQYTPPLPFPTYYNTTKPLLTSIIHIAHTNIHHHMHTFLQNFPIPLLHANTTYAIPAFHTTQSLNIKIPGTWENARPPHQIPINPTSPLPTQSYYPQTIYNVVFE